MSKFEGFFFISSQNVNKYYWYLVGFKSFVLKIIEMFTTFIIQIYILINAFSHYRLYKIRLYFH